jgi:hypothetical protein
MARNTVCFVLLFGLLCLPRVGLSEEVVPAASTSSEPVSARIVVERAIGYLQTESASWLSTRKCAACHHAPLPLWALAEADRAGYAIDKKYLDETFNSLLGSKEGLLASRIFPNPADPPDPRPQGRGLNMGLPFLAVAARALPALSEGQKQSLQLIADEIVAKQQADGSWEFFDGLRRPPINECQITDAAWIIMALAAETGPDSPPARPAALANAMSWLHAAKPGDLHQEKIFKLLLGIRFDQPSAELQPTVDELFALQREDGGWSQTVPNWESDAYATGQSLYALGQLGYTAERPEIQRGIDFLVSTQLADGTWPMLSRSTPDGSPGSSTLMSPIQCAAASWATLGLTALVSAKP